MLRASWLGSWKPPWGLGLGRRWGDVPWALAAISQAWLLGGHEGRWPELEQAGSWPQGPWVTRPPTRFRARPDPAWIARLRHGRAQLDASHRGSKEEEWRAWAWEALGRGDGAPWMAMGSLLLDLPQRLRWVAVLGAVDDEGVLHLPPYLTLATEGLEALPLGWWETLLSGMDADGHLLPAGTPDPALPWDLLQAHAGPLTLPTLPAPLRPWGHPLTSGDWMLAPHLRAWARAPGASPKALHPRWPLHLGAGQPPSPGLSELLALREPREGPPGWAPNLHAEVLELRPRPAAPPPSGDPTWDRLRLRWGGEEAPLDPGYPAWGSGPHPCADPFHWMAEGARCMNALNARAALDAFTLAHAHFTRLVAPRWAERAAFNAAVSALQWADLPAHTRWATRRGPLPKPWGAMEAAQLAEVHQEPDGALKVIRSLVEAHPQLAEGWGLLAAHGAQHGRLDLVQEGLAHAPDHPYTHFLRALLEGPLGPCPEDVDPETRLSWLAQRLLQGEPEAEAFWEAWEGCPTRVMSLELGLQTLEQLPVERTSDRLLALQVLADRAASPRHQRRLAALWPPAEVAADPAPRELLQGWLEGRGNPAWIHWEETGQRQVMGAGEPPPEGLWGCLAREPALPALRHGPWVWRSFPLVWEGCHLGALLLAQPPDAPPESGRDRYLLAPWLARLRARPTPTEAPAGLLLTDGSEPMATLLRELSRVAPTGLPVLILGPTGSGKEVTARELHRRSGRSGPLVAVNCAAFAEGLLESELFGHVRGAFTGAERERRGAVEAARGGTLLLDEVADLSPRLQSLLLRVLQEQEVRRVGSDHAVKVDVRFAAATHRSLEELAAQGAFRRDLLFRLQGAILELPPLSARRHEFPFLLPHLVGRAAASLQRPAPDVSPGLAEALARLPWSGNMRGLLHVLERAVLRCEDGLLSAHHLPELKAPLPQTHTWVEGTRAYQRRLLRETLQTCGHRPSEAARRLGLTRPALYATAQRLGVDLVAERVKSPKH